MTNRYASFSLKGMLRFFWILALLFCGHAAGQGLPEISLAELPPEAHDTLRAIKQGGPYAYPRDGVVFKNYERILPKHPRGYYHEYTVKTPGARNRGARRIICGAPAVCYYTADHYQTFKLIRE